MVEDQSLSFVLIFLPDFLGEVWSDPPFFYEKGERLFSLLRFFFLLFPVFFFFTQFFLV